VVVTGSGLLAVGLRGAPEGRLSASPFAVAVGTAGVIAIAGHAMGVTTEALLASLRQRFPVDAADFIESERLEGPMYNDYNWGGYLMWRLPQRKVSIDGRTYVHSTDYILRSLRNWRAEPGWDADPELAAAGFVVGSKHWPLTTALRAIRAFAWRTRMRFPRSSSGSRPSVDPRSDAGVGWAPDGGDPCRCDPLVPLPAPSLR
jgi:hypothetical protein